MKILYPVIILFFLVLSSSTVELNAQELEFDVTVNTPKLQTVDPKVFQDMESQLQNFLNNTKWTNDEFGQQEKIKCNIQLTISCLLYTSPSPRDQRGSRMPSSA